VTAKWPSFPWAEKETQETLRQGLAMGADRAVHAQG
jgi:electron transfer flavoprotein alpha/beta subunit